MNCTKAILEAELMKLKRAPVVGLSFAAFALAPVMGILLMAMMQQPESFASSGMLKNKADMMAFQADWPSYLSLLSQAVGVGGILVFGFAASWMFGREYADGTAKDLLALPVSRSAMLHAKFFLYACWSLLLAGSNLLLGLLLGGLAGLPGWDAAAVAQELGIYTVTVLLTLLTGTPVAFAGLAGKGYLAPLGAVALTLVLAQILAAIGLGAYVPWSVPGLYSGSAGAYREQLNVWSYLILLLCAVAGYWAALWWWNRTDQG